MRIRSIAVGPCKFHGAIWVSRQLGEISFRRQDWQLILSPNMSPCRQIWRYCYGGKNKIFSTRNPIDLETISNMLLCDSDEEEDIVLDESDTDEEEHISEREEDSEPE
ncbi:hypothetical protein NPIL_472191 [Nephila pilipes]|uniref:Uncharacterized protein n=1 Tax=Nephila pilipes TaxID=299642 RepID=A0A8X6R1Z9_NEPPI|nr:hypothetical protein NPIL_472191 [Nephila pilipes]